MTNVVIAWKDPVVAAGIEFIDVQASVDGQNFSSIAHVPAGAQTITDQDVQPGEWFYSVIVVPLAGEKSDPVIDSIDVPFPKAGPVTDLVLTLA